MFRGSFCKLSKEEQDKYEKGYFNRKMLKTIKLQEEQDILNKNKKIRPTVKPIYKFKGEKIIIERVAAKLGMSDRELFYIYIEFYRSLKKMLLEYPATIFTLPMIGTFLFKVARINKLIAIRDKVVNDYICGTGYLNKDYYEATNLYYKVLLGIKDMIYNVYVKDRRFQQTIKNNVQGRKDKTDRKQRRLETIKEVEELFLKENSWEF